MSKELLTDEILRQAVRMAAEKNYQDAVEDARLHPHTFRPDFHKKMRPLLKETALFTGHTDTGRSSRSGGQSNSFLRQLHARKPRASSLHLRRRYLAVASLLMIFVSGSPCQRDGTKRPPPAAPPVFLRQCHRGGSAGD